MRVLLGLLSLLWATSVLANEVDCLLDVQGTRYLDGVCNGEFHQGGSFTLGFGGGSPYFISVKRNPNGTATANWNGTPGRSSADYPLGTLTRSGPCWVGEQARACAWKIGEERWFVDQSSRSPPELPAATQQPNEKPTSTQIGAWTVSKNLRDDASGATIAAAVLTNLEGYRVALFRGIKDRPIQIGLSLPRGSFEQTVKAGRVAAYKLDDKDVEFLDTTGIRGSVTRTLTTGQAVTSVIFSGEGPIPATGMLREILTARRMVVRFYTDHNSYLETAFDLADVDRAVQAALF
ncbi:hypothetical protein QA649_37120 [Bradyrhizobium sp. CB1717]|uniref:hypothetical protein n=1 Tax=Bradyrhizobium sp. CB1717 TaxID=3039154 RepID=UPI0024B063FD|nr:hypothetical protein [Bradyrhizobium sp. CB1717]WFU23583.1 hypothetical protein QA649_37120 [Bradyrhizobium sp. CB1717]